ncbi:diacylglycerol O-acyltransferase 2D [Medicago truncatula]|uniref:Acyltransferase n=1 Tax=Medicago truncatula TaxID=3880 RepID=A0A072VHE2_MEDTR|nr:diacylglycerol O-acyltransferase 2D [Medicago truncatula]KEH40833.1 diacylglycerol acyltransferase type 2 [Medicago truncatula]
MGKVLQRNTKSSNRLKSVVALALCFGAIHFNIALILFALFFLPLSKALLVFALLIVFMVLPANKNSYLGRKISRFIGKHVRSYFPITLHLDDDPQAFHPNQSYVFAYEPHSVFPFGIFALLDNVDFPIPNIRFLVSSSVFYIPFLRQVWIWLGFTSVDKKNLISLLEAGNSCMLVPGGNRETLFMEHGFENVFLKERRGFVRIAMEMGHPLVPVFCFGQTKTYKWWKVPGKLIENIARSLKTIQLIFWGVLGSPIPFKNPLYVAVGRPIQVEKILEPTREQVAKVHSEFLEALQDLFERHKTQAGYTNLKLKFV